MAPHQVTVEGEVLQRLFVRDDGLARLAEWVLNQVLEAEATEQIKAKRYERSEERRGYRNGHRPRPLNTRVGRLITSAAGRRCLRPWRRWSSTASAPARWERLWRSCAMDKGLDSFVRQWNRRDLSGQE